MHGTAAAADASRRLAANLRHHAFEIAAFGEIVRVATVRAVDLVGRLKCSAGADGNCFLAESKDGPDSAFHLHRNDPRSPPRSGECAASGGTDRFASWGQATRQRRDSYAVRQLCSRRTIQIVSGLIAPRSNGSSRALTPGLVPLGFPKSAQPRSRRNHASRKSRTVIACGFGCLFFHL